MGSGVREVVTAACPQIRIGGLILVIPQCDYFALTAISRIEDPGRLLLEFGIGMLDPQLASFLPPHGLKLLGRVNFMTPIPRAVATFAPTRTIEGGVYRLASFDQEPCSALIGLPVRVIQAD